MGVIPGGRGNDFARVLGIPDDPAGAVAALAGGASREIDVGEVNGRRFLCIASCGFDSDANRIANEARFIRGSLVYAYAALRALVAWKPARFTITLDGERRGPRRLLGRRRQQQRLRRRHVHRPRRRARRRPARRGRRSAKVGKLRFLVNLPKVFKGTHVEQRRGRGLARGRGADRGRPPVRRLRRRRAPRRPAGDGAGPAAGAARDRPRDDRARRPEGPASGPSSRSRGRPARSAAAAGAAAAPPCRDGCCCGWRRTRSRASARGWSTGATIVSATNGKTTTAGMIAAALRADGRDPVHNRAGSNMTWGVATALLEQRGSEGLFEVDEAWLPRMAAELDPRLIVLGNLFRDQLDRYGELERLADEWATMVERLAGRSRLRPQRRRPAGRRPRPRPGAAPARGRHLLRDRGPLAGAARAPARPRRQALPPLRAPLRLRARLRRPPRPLRAAPTAAPTGRRPTSRRPRSSCAGCEARASRIVTPDGELELELPLPGLYNVYNALAALAAALRLGIDAERTAAARWPRCEAAFGRVETIAVDGRPVSILLIKNPAGANEVLRTLRLEAERAATAGSTSGSRSTTGSPTAATSPGSGTPTSSCSPAPCAGSSAPGTRAPEMALRLKYAGLDPEAIEVEPSRSSARSTARSPAPTGALFALPTYTALLELRTLLADRGLAREFWR